MKFLLRQNHTVRKLYTRAQNPPDPAPLPDFSMYVFSDMVYELQP